MEEWREVSLLVVVSHVNSEQETWVFKHTIGQRSERIYAGRYNFWNDFEERKQSFGYNVSIVLLGNLNLPVGGEVVEGIKGKVGVPGIYESSTIDWFVYRETVSYWKYVL